jgi:NAD(P)-dependent dehydrogenase (short-subunit alcohol dehydrogenase family)
MADPQEVRRLVAEGAQALIAGRREEAQQLLLSAVEQDEQNEDAWLWLSGAVEDPDDMKVALENCLAINPANERAKQGLEWLSQNQ